MIAFAQEVAEKLQLKQFQTEAVLHLLAEGATIPFIARYRKDKTGALDEVQIQQIQEEAKLIKEFTERKAFIIKTITEQEKMTEALSKKIEAATTIATLEDIYLPYKPKRKTKAQAAKENGLEPLAELIMEQEPLAIEQVAEKYLNDHITSVEQALQGARDIIAERINEDADLRAKLRNLFAQEALIESKVLPDKEEQGIKFKDYFDFAEPIHKVPSHRTLAILRGFMEGFLRVSIAPNEDQALSIIENTYVRPQENEAVLQVKRAVKDAYRRLLQPSLETECRTRLKQEADEEAINVFAENLRQLLLSSPLGSKKMLAIDPGYRTGCKVVVLDEKGELQKTDLIFVHEKNHRLIEAENTIRQLSQQYHIEAIAIGDGTAGRETEQFIKGLQLSLPVFLVNEDGASVYSASETAREEFPHQDVTVRGAVSIGRRLMDPLAELVKIDPKSIGVGQYQHDVNQYRLKEKLDQTVVSCVNAVGVNLNTASKHLLSYVSGIGPSLAENIVQERKTLGKFENRKQLLKVPRLGGKAYEQCAGFLRIHGGANPLDKSAVHPESYPIVEQMAQELAVDVETLIGNESLINKIDYKKYVSAEVGIHTLQDILSELKKPGLDPRSEMETFSYADVYSLEDVKVGDILPGIVTNITRFGAFVDIGVKQDGLVHVSEIAHQYITDPSEVLKLNDKVKVKVLEVDLLRKRIALSIKQTKENTVQNKQRLKQNTTQQKSSGNMQDALSLLKKKFGK